MARGEDRFRTGLSEIERLAGTMNPSGKRGTRRRRSSELLREVKA
jgi:hypothetical protein